MFEFYSTIHKENTLFTPVTHEVITNFANLDCIYSKPDMIVLDSTTQKYVKTELKWWVYYLVNWWKINVQLLW